MNKKDLIKYFDRSAETRDAWKRRNWYYHAALQKLAHFFIPPGKRVLEIGSATGDLLAALNPSRGVGVDFSPKMLRRAKEKYPHLEWREGDAEQLQIEETFDYIILSDLVSCVTDIEKVFSNLHAVCHTGSRIFVTHYNYFWEPIFRIAERLGLKERQPLQNWISEKDIENMLHLAGFEVIKQGTAMPMPIHVPVLSSFVNKILGNLPLLRALGVVQYYIARLVPREPREYSVSIIIPCRNEKGNIEEAIKRLPAFGTSQEIIFVEGHSTDGTLEEVKRVTEKCNRTTSELSQVIARKSASQETTKQSFHSEFKNEIAAPRPENIGARNDRVVRWAVQAGRGKGDAVRKGFSMATGEVLMILDADLTVAPEDLPKFYNAIRSGKGEFINGSRLVYPMEKEAMRFFNVLGNKFFSTMFTWLLGQRIKDTLCGTKVLFKKDYEAIAEGRTYFGDFDPFGDFDLLFGAAKLNLKIVELPIRYGARIYGQTNIQRWRHGWLLLKMVVFAMRKIKFI